jgi:hypothetical protein
MDRGDDICTQIFSQKTRREKTTWEIHKLENNIKMDLHVRTWTGFIWLRISSSEHGNERWGISLIS